MALLTVEEARELTAFTFDYEDIYTALLNVAEAACVEYAWRVYLLPRLLFSLLPYLALLSMALLATLSSFPVLLYTVCTDILTYPESTHRGDLPVISRHPPMAPTYLCMPATR